MSKEKKTNELKDKQLQAVCGGLDPKAGGTIKPCPKFSLRAGGNTIEEIYGSPLAMGQGYIEYYDCTECNYYRRPEGPCELEG